MNFRGAMMAFRSVSTMRGGCVFGVFRMSIHRGSREWNMKSKNRARSLTRLKIYRTIVPLQNLIGLSQSDATSVFLGRKVELENLIV
jgi:hypothetical protein